MNITVTQDHINAGVKTQCRMCPIALAITDLGLGYGFAGPINCYIFRNTNDIMPIYQGTTTTEMLHFMTKFDRDKPVSPTTFVLEMEECE